jgi:hypothetical protein
MNATAPDFIRAGLTYRRLDHAVARGWLIPDADPNPGSGRRRTFPWSEVRIAELMVHLTDAGIEVEEAARIARDRAGGAAKLRRLAELVEVGP